MPDSFRKLDLTAKDGSVPLQNPANWPKGSFLYWLNARERPVLAEGVLPGPNAGAGRTGSDQRNMSKPYNFGDPTREQRRTNPNWIPGVTKIHAGHLIPHILGGSGEAYNMVPITQSANLSDCKKLEGKLANQIRRGDIYLQVYVTYPTGRDFPSSLRYVAYEMSGKQIGQKFMDESFNVQDIWN